MVKAVGENGQIRATQRINYLCRCNSLGDTAGLCQSYRAYFVFLVLECMAQIPA